MFISSMQLNLKYARVCAFCEPTFLFPWYKGFKIEGFNANLDLYTCTEQRKFTQRYKYLTSHALLAAQI